MIISLTGNGTSYQISTITDGALVYSFNDNPIFELEILKNDDLEFVYLDAGDFEECTCRVDSDNKLKISYYKQSVIPGLVKVHISGVAGENSEADLSIDVMFKVDGYSLKSLKFPYLKLANLSNDNVEQVIVIPATKIGGAYCRHPASGTAVKSFNYPGTMGMQFVSMLHNTGGHNLYVQQLDEAAYMKDFYYAGNASGSATTLAWTHYPINGDEPLVSFYSPYKTRLASLSGGTWFDSAEKYKTWATGQSWAQYRGKLHTNTNGLHSSGAMRSRLGILQAAATYDEAGFTDLKNDLDGFKSSFTSLFNTNIAKNQISVVWYGWHGGPSTSYVSGTVPWPDWSQDPGIPAGLFDIIAEAKDEGYTIAPYTYETSEFPVLSQRWVNQNSYHLNFIKQYVYNSLMTLPELIEYVDDLNDTVTATYNLIDPQRSDFADSLFPVYSGAIVSGGFNGVYFDVYPSETPINYNPAVTEKGGSPNSHMGYIPHHARVKAFATGYLSGDFIMLSEYSNEISLMDIDLPNTYRAEQQTGDTIIVSNSGLITIPLMSSVYHEYSRLGCFDYFSTGQDIARIMHDGQLPGWLLLHNTDTPGSPVIGNVYPTAALDPVGYVAAALDSLKIFSAFTSSSGATDKYLIYGSKLRPVSGSREWNAVRSDAAPTGGEIQVSAWRSQDNYIGIIASSCSVTGSFNVVLPTGDYLTSGTTYTLYTASGSYGGAFNLQSTGTATGYYNGTIHMDNTYSVKLLEFRP